jgi:hypothetical protein
MMMNHPKNLCNILGCFDGSAASQKTESSSHQFIYRKGKEVFIKAKIFFGSANHIEIYKQAYI